MKNKINKTAAIFIVAIFALAGVATGYAMWSQDLTITGTVTSGEVDWEWSPQVGDITIDDRWHGPPYIEYTGGTADFVDYDKNYDPNIGFGSTAFWTKNVGWGEIDLLDKYTVELIIHNAYPGYWNRVTTHIHGLGTVPIKIQEVIISKDPEMTDIVAHIGLSNEDNIFEIDLNGDTNIDMELDWGDNFGAQVHNCDTKEISFEFCFLQPLPQNQIDTLHLYITIRAVQWNEYDDPTD